MRAIIQEGYGSPDVLHLRDIDTPVAADDRVLVRVRAASVNAADCHLLHLPLPARVFFGLRKPKVSIRGFDLSGHVEAVGRSVTRFKPGDEVFGHAHGTFAEYATAREDRLMTKPRRLTFEQASAVPVAGTTALQGLRDKAGVRPGQHVLIYGAGGGVGTFAVQIAKAFGAHVTAVTSTRNLDLVRSLGPDEVIDYTQEDFTRRGKRYDVFFDIAANRSLGECRHVLAPNGTFVAAGAAKAGTGAVLRRVFATFALSRFVSQRIVTFMARVCVEDLAVLKELIESGALTPVIERTYSLSEVPDAMRYVAGGHARAKVVINVS
jgi:NADPH:quinone reductase-like Zn-dependent oxidoreductase